MSGFTAPRTGPTVWRPPLSAYGGLTSRQAWDHAHIRRCDGCGAWEIVTDIELRMRAAEQWPAFVGPCPHVEAAFLEVEEAS